MKILVDGMNVVFITLNSTKSMLAKEEKELDKNNWPLFITMLMNRINDIFSTYNGEEIYFCWEGKNSLERRRAIYPEYKGNRGDTKKEESYKLLIEFLPKLQEIIKSYPCKSFQVEKCEADDVIYVLSEKYHKEDEVFILSTDNDLAQIQEKFGETVSMYNSVQRKYVVKKNVVLEKSIVGDKGDNIPGISRIGAKTFEKMITDELFMEEVLSKGNNRQIMEQFKKIVDLSLIPDELKKQILELDNMPVNEFDPDKIEMFFWEHKAKELIKKWPTMKTRISL